MLMTTCSRDLTVCNLYVFVDINYKLDLAVIPVCPHLLYVPPTTPNPNSPLPYTCNGMKLAIIIEHYLQQSHQPRVAELIAEGSSKVIWLALHHTAQAE